MLALLSTVAPLVTPILGKAIFGDNAKARAGGWVGGLSLGTPFIVQFVNGLAEGTGGAVHDLGFALGAYVIGGAVGYAVSWLSPSNGTPKQ